MKKSTKHMQFLRISLLIFAISFIFACSLGTQSYGKLSLSIEVPEYIKTEPNEQANNARFIHPNGDSLEFELYTERRVIHTQTIPLNPKSNSPQTVPISVDKVPYNVPLFAKITVYGTNPPTGDPILLGQNTIDIGKLRYPNRKLTLGVKPVNNDDTVISLEYVYDEDSRIVRFDWEGGSFPDPFNIIMYPQKGLYTVYGYFNSTHPSDSDNIYLYDSEGKTYQNSFLINSQYDPKFRVFYHPEDKANTYYAYLSGEINYLYGEKLEQDILITRPDGDGGNLIVKSVESGGEIDVYPLSRKEISFTIYNPYPFTLNPKYSIKEENLERVTFTKFPIAILPGTSKEFTVIFESIEDSEEIPITISANGLKDLVLTFIGSYS